MDGIEGKAICQVGAASHFRLTVVGDTVTYSASNLPPGIHFSTSTHTFSGTPTSTGSWTVTYKATDSHGASSSKTFTMKVNAPAPQPPVYNGGIPDTVLMRPPYGGTAVYTFPSTAFSSPAGETLHYSAVMSGSQHALVTFNSATHTFTAQSYPNGDYDVSVVLYATDTGGRSVSHSFQFAVVTKLPPGGGGGTPRVIGGPGLETTDAMAAQQAEQSGTPNIQSYWFTYDADNRVDISGGDLVEGQIQFVDRTGSVENQYNLAGEVVTQLSNNGAQRTQTYRYDARGEQVSSTLVGGQVETKQYDPDGRLVADVYSYAPGTKVSISTGDVNNLQWPIGGWLSSATTYYYNDDGEVTHTFQYGRDLTDPDYWNDLYNDMMTGGRPMGTEGGFPQKPPPLTQAEDGYGGDPENGYPALTVRSKATYGSGSYDAEGNVKSYTYTGYDYQDQLQTTTYQVQYLKKDGYLEKSTTGSGTGQVTTTDTSVYDAFGRRIDIVSHSAGQSTDQVRAFAYDAEGEILQRRDGSATGSTFTVYDTGGYAIHHYAYADGQQVGNVDEHGTIDVLSGVTGFSNTEQGTSDYVAQAGDSMEIIAQRVYGDTSLWYVVADANGFDEASDVPAAGQILKLPEVTTNSNTAETFKPYNPRQISGSTTPSLPQAPMAAPSAHHCSTLAEIVVIAVVIVASIYTAGAAAEAFGATSGATFSTGASVLAGSSVAGVSTAEGIAAAAIGGAVGDAAGQLAGDALGVHQGFSWGEVAGAGLGAGITAGLAGEISGGQKIAQLHDAGGIANDARIAGIGAAGAIGSYSGEKLVGQPAHFSWANIAAAAVGTEATTALGLNSTLAQKWGQAASGSFAGNVVGGLVNGAIDSETARLLGGDAANGNQIAVDAFGNALGNAAIAGIEHENARSGRPHPTQSQPAQSTSSPLAPDDANSTANPIAAFYAGQYADSGEYADALANYNPFNGPLLASADGYSTYTGAYGLPSPPLTPFQAADVRSMKGATPQLPAGEWSSDIWQTWLGADGDVWTYTNPVYDVNGAPVMENGLQVSEAPMTTVTPSAEELAQARGGPQMFTTSSSEGARYVIRSQLGLPKDAIISANSIMNVAQLPGPYTEAANSGPELSAQALEDRARHEFGGTLVFSVEVKGPVLTTFAMVNGTDAVNANMAMMNGANADTQDYAYDHATASRGVPENEQPKAVIDGIGLAENIGTEAANVPASRLEYRYDVFVSPSDPSNFRVEVTQYNFDYAHRGGMLHYHPFLHQASVLLNGSNK